MTNCFSNYFSYPLGVFSQNASKDINMLEYPEPSKTIKFGEQLELEWKYGINMTSENKWKISLFEFSYDRGRKTKLLVLLESGMTVLNPNYLPRLSGRLDMVVSYDKAKITAPATFEISTGYGIQFQANEGRFADEHFEKFTEINVIGNLN